MEHQMIANNAEPEKGPSQWHLLDLPTDVLRTIWSYLLVDDVFRFSLTAKNMLNSTWKYAQSIENNRFWPLKAIITILSQDLSQVRDLDITKPIEVQDDKEKNSELLGKIAALGKPPNLLPNLQSLLIDIHSQHQYNIINDFISSQTQIQSLCWYSAQFGPNLQHFGHFSNYNKLTQLTIETESKRNNLLTDFTLVHGLQLLTQLESLNFPYCDEMDDDTFSDVVTLTHLTRLNIEVNDISDSSFTKISNLTNLEQFDMEVGDGVNLANLAVLTKLPKLSKLRILHPFDITSDFSSALNVYGQLSKLTSLEIDIFKSVFDFDVLKNLTKLKEFSLNAIIQKVDLSNLTNLSKLSFRPTGYEFEVVDLPPNLQHLILQSHVYIEERYVQMICNLSHLKELEFREPSVDLQVLAKHITHLTSLTALTFFHSVSKEVIQALQSLPNLVRLCVSIISTDTIDDLAKLTQLMSLTYFREHVKGLKTRLPFHIIFKGDPNSKPAAEAPPEMEEDYPQED